MTLAQTYQQEITAITQTIAADYQPKKIILFGSAARGELHGNSDIDLLIIKESSKKAYDRTVDLLHILKNVDRHFPLDPLVMTPAEFALGEQQGRYLIRQIIKDGQVLYEA